jgi:membrane-bound inhibitor of C-type lysozyme
MTLRPAPGVLLAALLSAVLSGNSAAVPPAQVGKDRPITREWKCENGRVLLLNSNPRRSRKLAWVTYGGNRAQVYRVPSASGIAYASKDGTVKWHEKGDEGTVEYVGVTDAPVACRLERGGKN